MAKMPGQTTKMPSYLFDTAIQDGIDTFWPFVTAKDLHFLQTFAPSIVVGGHACGK